MKVHAKFKNPIRLFGIVLLAVGMAACGGSGGVDAPASGGGTGGGSGATALEGTWVKACGIGKGEDPTDPKAFYDVVTLKFTGSNFESDIKNYSDSGCTVPIPNVPNPTAKGSFVLGNVTMTTGGLQATEIDSHITEFNGAPFDIDDFDIFRIDGVNLYFGDISGINDGTAPALRPNTLDFNRVYMRQ